MANLVVRNIDEEVVRALKAKAGLDGISAEAEHRKNPRDSSPKAKKKSFAQVLKAIPDVGIDTDFEQVQDDRPKDVFA